MIIGDRLRALREEKKLSQGDIEKRTGLLRCYISRVENGHTVPAIETMEKFARALEVPLYQLFYDGEEPPKLPKLRAVGSVSHVAINEDFFLAFAVREGVEIAYKSSRLLEEHAPTRDAAHRQVRLRSSVMRKCFLTLLFLAFCSLLVGQQTLNNDAVIKLVKARLSDDLIVATINAQPGNYDTSTDGLIALKRAGASDKVVVAILKKAAAPATAAPAAQTPASASAPAAQPAASAPAPTAQDPDDPMAPHEVGVYVMTSAPDGKRKMVFVSQAGEQSAKTSGLLAAAFTFGAKKCKMKAELAGPRAAVRTTDARPVFYMYFPAVSSLGGYGGQDLITSPNQFSLQSLEIKSDHRETTFSKVGFGSATMGADEKRVALFSSDRIRSGMYKVTPAQDLRPGEYAFISATRGAGTATGTTVVIYDFGVDAR